MQCIPGVFMKKTTVTLNCSFVQKFDFYKTKLLEHGRLKYKHLYLNPIIPLIAKGRNRRTNIKSNDIEKN